MRDLAASGLAVLSIGAARVFAIAEPIIPLPGSTMDEILQWAKRDSPLLLVILLVLYFYRRDFRSERQTLITMVKQTTTAMVANRGVNARLARAVEAMNRRHRPGDPPVRDDEEDYLAEPNEG